MTFYRNPFNPNRTFDPDMRGYGQMLCMPGMRRRMDTLANVVQALAEANSPDSGDEDNDDYKSSFETSSGIQPGRLGPRAYGQCVNTSDHAFAVEFGAQSTPKYRPLRTALDAIPAVHRSDH